MLKRLIFAVFVLGLFFTLNGTAISDSALKDWSEPAYVAPVVDADVPQEFQQAQALYKEFDPAEHLYVGDDFNLMPRERSGWFCGAQVPYGSYSWLWLVPDGGDSVYANRFVMPQGQMGCTLTYAWGVVYYGSGGLSVGNPTMRWYLWEDNGFGLPGTLLDSVDRLIMDPATTTGAWWHGVDFSPASNSTGLWHVFDEGESYLVGWKTVQDPQSGVDDVIGTISDDADGPYLGEKRGVMMRDNVWGTMFDFFGAELCQWIDIEYCGWETPPSDCYQKTEFEGITHITALPHYGTLTEQRYQSFIATKRETLYSVEVSVYGGAADPLYPGEGDGSLDVSVAIYDDNAGFPGAQVGSMVTWPGGTYPLFPSNIEFDMLGENGGDNFVFEPGQMYHIVISTSGIAGLTYEYIAINVDSPSGRAGWFDTHDTEGGGNIWYVSGYDYGIFVNVCTDAFDECQYYWTGYYGGSVYPIPDANPILGWGQAIPTQGDECAVRYIEIWMYRHSVGDAERPDMYTYNSEVNVYSDVDGAPGNLLGQIVLTPQDYADAGYTGPDYFGFIPIRIYDLNIIVPPGQCFIELRSLAPDQDHGIRLLMATDGEGQYAGGLWCYAPAFGGWLNNPFGWVEPAAADIEAEICCIPYSERDCFENERAGEDWFTYQHDYARSGASYNSVGEHPECNLNVNWYYEHPSDMSLYNSPVIVGDKVATGFDSHYKVFDLSSGSELYTLTGPNFGACRSTPTVAVIDIEGTPTEVIFIAGGTSQGVACHDFSDGSLIWERVVTGPSTMYGYVLYSSFTVLTIGDTEVLYWATEDGNIMAAEAATGALYAGWTAGPNGNPVNVGMPIANKSGCTDGEYLYFGAYTATVVDGDIFKVDGATGAYETLVIHGGGLQATTVYPDGPQVGEGFTGGIAYEDGIIYANSRISDADHPGDGVLYAINTADLSIKWAVASARVWFGTPVIDMARIYCAYLSYWVTPPIGGQAAAFNKETGAFLWAFEPPGGDGYWCDPLLTCEPYGYPDHLFLNGHQGFLSCVNTSDGTEIFRRRFDYGDYSRSCGLALSATRDLVAQNNFGGLACLSLDLTKGDRPRLQIQTYNPEMAVEFGAATNLPVETPPLLYNSGCADLTITAITVDLECDDNYVPEFSAMAVRPDVMDRASSIADKLTKGFEAKAPRMTEFTDDDFAVRSERGEKILNAGAMVLPDVLNDPPILLPVMPYALGADEEITVTFDVNQSLISRGPQYFCIEVESDDPDFYLNSGAFPAPTGDNDFPSISVTLVGGCLRQYAELEFGEASDNVQLVYNTGCLGDADDGPGFTINADAGSFFQGSYVYAITQHRLATAAPDWRGRGGFHLSMQADPNWCDGMCAPNLTEDVQVGEISSDGETYDPVYATVVCKSYLDSCQNFDDGTGVYVWYNYDSPFDNDSTMGLFLNTRTVGANGIAALDDFTVEIMEVTERNDAEVLGWKFGAIIDYDIGSDTADIDRDVSTAWAYTLGGGGDVVWGVIKLPFGCGEADGENYNFEPMKNVVAIDAGQALWGDFFWDSAYHYMTLDPGAYGHSITGSLADDQEFFCTITENDFEGLETYVFAVAHFAMHGVTDPTVSDEFGHIALLANKWCGFGRGDVNDDGAINLADLVWLNNYVHVDGPGPIPFMHCGDVDGTPGVDAGDVTFMIDFYFGSRRQQRKHRSWWPGHR